jgi:hypothetical protein
MAAIALPSWHRAARMPSSIRSPTTEDHGGGRANTLWKTNERLLTARPEYLGSVSKNNHCRR